MKRKVIVCMIISAIMFLIPIEKANAGVCDPETCGCREKGIESCKVGDTCWYDDGDGCVGHSWYLYESYGATCTGSGTEYYRCSTCPGERVFTTPALQVLTINHIIIIQLMQLTTQL